MRKLVIVLVHIAFWHLVFFGFGSYYEVLGHISGVEKSMWSYSFFQMASPQFLFVGINFYVFYLFITPKFLINKDYPKFFGFGIFSTVASVILFTIILPLSRTVIYNITDFDIHSYITCFIYASVLGVSGSVLRIFIQWFKDLLYKKELEKKNLETELALLKSQINPHFLFNTLNNIDVLITKDSEKASVYMKKLSDILRFMLYKTKDESIPLNLELEHIEKYIDLQKIRTLNDSFVDFRINGKADEIKIAPMIFIPFIENAFKHTSNKKTINAIKIQFDISSDSIKFICKNIKNKYDALIREQSGLGVNLIEQRLNLLYKNKHILKIEDSEEYYLVVLTIQLNED